MLLTALIPLVEDPPHIVINKIIMVRKTDVRKLTEGEIAMWCNYKKTERSRYVSVHNCGGSLKEQPI